MLGNDKLETVQTKRCRTSLSLIRDVCVCVCVCGFRSPKINRSYYSDYLCLSALMMIRREKKGMSDRLEARRTDHHPPPLCPVTERDWRVLCMD